MGGDTPLPHPGDESGMSPSSGTGSEREYSSRKKPPAVPRFSMTWNPKRAAKAQSSVHSGQRGISPAIRRIPEIPAVEPFGGTSISRAFFPRASGIASGRGRSGPSGRTTHQRFPIGYGGTAEERDLFRERRGTFWGSSFSESG